MVFLPLLLVLPLRSICAPSLVQILVCLPLARSIRTHRIRHVSWTLLSWSRRNWRKRIVIWWRIRLLVVKWTGMIGCGIVVVMMRALGNRIVVWNRHIVLFFLGFLSLFFGGHCLQIIFSY